MLVRENGRKFSSFQLFYAQPDQANSDGAVLHHTDIDSKQNLYFLSSKFKARRIRRGWLLMIWPKSCSLCTLCFVGFIDSMVRHSKMHQLSCASPSQMSTPQVKCSLGDQ